MGVGRRYLRGAIASVLLGSGFLGTALDPARAAGDALVLGQTIAGALEVGETATFSIDLEANRTARLTARPAAGATDLELRSPEGEILRTVALQGKPWLVRELSILARQGGRYELRARGAGPGKQASRYEVTLLDSRPAVATDTRRIEAETAFETALGLQRETTSENLENALASLEEARTAWQAAGYPKGEIRARQMAGEVQISLGQMDEGFESLTAALHLSQAETDPVGEAEAANSLGLIERGRGRLSAATELFDRALALARDIASPGLEALALNSLGILDYQAGETDGALDKMQAALELRKSSGDLQGAAASLINQGAIYRRLGRSREASSSYLEALELTDVLGDLDTRSAALNNLGVLYRTRGEIGRALDVLTRALDTAAELGDGETEASVAANLGSLYRTLGELDRARDLHERALGLARALGTPDTEARSLLELGRIEELLGRIPEALERYNTGLVASERAQDPKSEGYLLQSVGRCLLTMGATGEALDVLTHALEIQAASRDLTAQSGTLLQLGLAHLPSGPESGAAAESDSVSLARDYLNRSLEAAERVGEPYQTVAARAALARLERRTGALADATRQIATALETLETLRREVPNPELQISFFSENQSLFALYIELLMDSSRAGGHPEQVRLAFEASERARARGLLDLLTEARIDLETGIAEDLLEHERTLAAERSRLQRDLIRELSRPETDGSAVEGLQTELDALALARQDLETRIRLEHPAYAEIAYPRPARLESVQALLDDQTLLVEYALGETRSYLFAVTHDALAAFELPDRETIAALANDVRTLLGRPGRRQLGELQQKAAELHELVLGPVADLLAGKSRLIVAPDAELHYVPFEALVRRPGGPYLITDLAISYVPSASVLASLEANRRPLDLPGRLLGFADPAIESGETAPTGSSDVRAPADRPAWAWRRLPGSRAELAAIAEQLGGDRAEVFVGAGAREAVFKTHALLPTARYLHLATHARVDEDRPADTAILMSRGVDDLEDGLLQPDEIFDLRINADLVVLSGCETALGRRARGEGLLGFTRAFLFAGARTVAVSLWPVADASTRDLMTHFYRELEAGAEKASALRVAKLALIRQGSYSHPYYWAPFILVGQAHPVPEA